MRGALWGALLAVAACGRTAPPPGALAVATTPVVTAIWSVDRASPGSRAVDLRFVASSCSVVRRVVVAESASRVVITLDQSGREGKDCTEPHTRYRHVVLAAPLGHRSLYDGGAAPPALVRPGT